MLNKTSIINTAQKLASKGMIDKAIAEWEKLLENGKDGNVYNTIGDLYLKKGSEDNAVESFTKAAEIFKKDGFYPKAIALYRKILNIVPNDVNAIISIAKLNADKGLIANAIDNYFKAAEIYHREGSTEKATKVVERILQLSPSDLESRKKIAYLYFRLGLRERASNEYSSIGRELQKNGDLEKAEEMLNKAVEYEPQNTKALSGLSGVAEKKGEIDRAFECLEKAISFEPDNKTLLLNYATLLQSNDRVEEAGTALIQLIEAHPDDLRAKKMLGKIYLDKDLLEQAWEEILPCVDDALESENWTEALELLQSFNELHPLEVKRRMLTICIAQDDEETIQTEQLALAGMYEKESLFHEALLLYRDVLETNPVDATASGKVLELEQQLGIGEQATQAQPAEATAEPGDRSPLDTPSPEEAAPDTLDSSAGPSSSTGMMESQPFNLAERKAEADFFAQQGLSDEALAIYEEILTHDPENEEIKNQIKSFSSSPEAEDQTEVSEAVVVKETEPDEITPKSTLDDDLKDIFSSFEAPEEEQKPEDYEARYQAGIEYRQKGLFDEAINELRIAAQDSEKTVRNTTMLAMCYMEKGSYPMAVAEFTKVMEMMSPDESTYLHVKYELACACMKNGDKGKALEFFTEIHAQKPDFKDVSDMMSSLDVPAKENITKQKRDRVSYI